MRPAPWTHLDRFRKDGHPADPCGAFVVPHQPTSATLAVVASSDLAWEHVSVSLRNRTPNWREMEFVCRLFWTDDEAVMQLHPPRSEWISNHPNCLHLWKPTAATIPLPPSWMVGTPALNGKTPADPGFAELMVAERARLEKELDL